MPPASHCPALRRPAPLRRAGEPTLSWLFPADVPVQIGRDEARDAARRELADPAYHAHEPSLLERGVRWVIEHVLRLIQDAAGATPGGWWSLSILLGVIVLTVLVVRSRIGPLARSDRRAEPVFTGRPLTSADHRRAAEAAHARGALAEAIRERFRAVVRDLEDRGVLEPRPGRTADEAAREAAVLLPGCADGLWAAARVFDEVWYGARPATDAAYQRIVSVDDQVQRTRPVPATRPALATPGLVRPEPADPDAGEPKAGRP